MAKNLKELDSLLELLRNFTSGDALTNEKFNGELKKVAQYFVTFQDEYMEKLSQMQSLLEKKLAELDENNLGQNDLNKKEIQAQLADLNSVRVSMESTIANRLAEVRDGKDADANVTAEIAKDLVVKELTIPTTEDLLNDVPVLATRIRDALELLQDDERLDASAIKGLEEVMKKWMKDVDGKITTAVGSISVPSPTNWTKHQSVSLSSGTTTYSLTEAPAHDGKACIVRYEGQVLDETTHYSFNGTDITLTFDPDNGTTLSVTYWSF